jgi:1-acyl-sn-glycerol-3-phosphate acyltransferase
MLIREAPPLYKSIRLLTKIILRFIVKLEISGSENFPKEGAVLVVTNHLHWLDTLVALVVMPCWGTVLMGEKWVKVPLWGQMLRKSKSVVFVNRGKPDRRALEQALNILRAGRVFGLAPEGDYSKARSLQKGHNGAAYLASRTGVPVVPLVIYGQENLFTSLLSFKRSLVRVVFGKAFVLPGTPNHANGKQLGDYTEEIMRKLATILPPEYRGVYQEMFDGNSYK